MALSFFSHVPCAPEVIFIAMATRLRSNINCILGCKQLIECITRSTERTGKRSALGTVSHTVTTPLIFYIRRTRYPRQLATSNRQSRAELVSHLTTRPSISCNI